MYPLKNLPYYVIVVRKNPTLPHQNQLPRFHKRIHLHFVDVHAIGHQLTGIVAANSQHLGKHRD